MTAPDHPPAADTAVAAITEALGHVKRISAAVLAARVGLASTLASLGVPTDVPPGSPPPALPAAHPTLRERIVAVMEASPGEVFTPASLSKALGHPNRDSIRNTLLVLARQGHVDKLGEGQYQARKPPGEAAP